MGLMTQDDSAPKPSLGFLVLDGSLDIEHDGPKLDEHVLGTVPRAPEGDVHQVGGGPAVAAQALGLDGTASLSIRPLDEEQKLNGIIVVGRARTAAEQGDKRELGELIACFRNLALRVPEVHAFLDTLPRRTAEGLAGLRTPVGRPRNHEMDMACVRTIDLLMRNGRARSVRKAATMLAPLLETRVSVVHLQNVYSEHAEHAHIHTQGLFYPARRLTPNEWGASPTMTLRVLL